MPRRYYSSTAQRTTITAGITNVATSIPIATATGLPATYPYTMVIDADTGSEEIVEVTNRVTTTLTVVRGVDGTTAVAHNSGASIQHGFSARDFNEPNAFLNGALAANQPLLASMMELWTASATAATGTINIDVATSSILYYTANATLAFNINVRASSTAALSTILAVGESVTVMFLNTNGVTPYTLNTTNYFLIDSVVTTPLWAGGTKPAAGNASSVDAYTFTIYRNASSYNVFASMAQFK